ncbi:hypothetical protein KHQ81_10650 [Mycoplasmatota bacterium]|nr:hypothetical protein KHQ81_10650 [Mycoplasmatota bacterium]
MKRLLIFSTFVFIMGTIYLSTGIEALADGSMYLKGIYFSNIREEITLNDKTYLAVSTDTNLYLLENQEIKFEYQLNQDSIFIEAIDDLNGNGYDELLIITNAKNKDNILLYDTLEGERIYSYASKMRAYSSNSNAMKPTGYYDEYVVVEDYVIDGDQFYGIAGYNAFRLDLKNQKEIWQIEAEDNLWDIEKIGDINHDNVEDVVVSLQTKDIIALSGINGNVIYQKSVSESLKDNRNNTYPTSIWNMQYDEETSILYAASENGKVYKIDSKNGQVLGEREISIINLERGYNRPSYGDSRFKGYSVELINDITGDGKKDLIYYEMTHPYKYKREYSYNNEEISIQFIDGQSLEVLNEKLDLDGGGKYASGKYGFHYLRGTYHGEPVIYVFDSINRVDSENSLVYKIFSINQNAYLNDELKVKNQGDLDVYFFSFLVLNNNEVAVFSTQNLLFQHNGEILNKISMIKAEDFILDGDRILLLQGGYSGRGYFNFDMISLETDESLWHYQLEDEDYSEYSQIDFSSDFNQDNIKDVVVVNTRGDNNQLPWVMLIDGKTGQKVSKISIAIEENDIADFSDYPTFDAYLHELGYYLSILTTYGIYNDVNQDGFNEYYITNSLGELYIINFSDNELYDYFSPNSDIVYQSNSHYVINYFNGAIKVSDIDGDFNEDFIQVISEDERSVVQLIQTNDFEFNTEIIESFQQTRFNLDNNLGDIDEDGINDLAFRIYDRTETYGTYYIISSKTGDVVTSIPCTREDYFYLSDEDINGDQLKELYHVTYNWEKYEQSVLLYDIAQETPHVLFTSPSYRPSNYNTDRPAVTFKDQDKFFIALHTDRYSSQSNISIYDLSNGALLDEIQIQTAKEKNYEDQYALGSIAVSKDGDDIYFYQVNNYYSVDRYYTRTKSFIYNYSDKQMSFYYINTEINRLDILGKKILLRDVFGQVINTKLMDSIKFKNLKENQTINKNIKLSFNNKKEGNVYIYVDHELVGFTDKDHYNLELLEGKHTISISQILPNGIETMDTVQVVVTKNYVYMIVVIVITITLFASAFILPRRKKRYPLPKDFEGSDK